MTGKAPLMVRNWDRWQTYRKDRSAPPWIKVHCRLLLDPNWNQLTDAQKGQLVSLWIVASDKNGALPNDKNLLRKICGLDAEPDIDTFISLGFLEYPMTTKKRNNVRQATTKKKNHDGLEAEAETEAETDAETDAEEESAALPPTPLLGLDLSAWQRWLEYRKSIRKPLKGMSLESAMKALAQYGPDQAAVVEQSISNGWQGLFPLKAKTPTSSAKPKSQAEQFHETLKEIARNGL